MPFGGSGRTRSFGDMYRGVVIRLLSTCCVLMIRGRRFSDARVGCFERGIENEKIIFKLLRQMADEGKCVIVVSHSSEITEYADINLLLEEGTLEEVSNAN